MFPCEYYEIFKNSFFTEHLQWLFLQIFSLYVIFVGGGDAGKISRSTNVTNLKFSAEVKLTQSRNVCTL